MHQIGEIGLDLRFGDIDDFEAFLNKQLEASDCLGTEVLSPVVSADFAQHRGDANIIGQADEQINDFRRVSISRRSLFRLCCLRLIKIVPSHGLCIRIDYRLNKEPTEGRLER